MLKRKFPQLHSRCCAQNAIKRARPCRPKSKRMSTNDLVPPEACRDTYVSVPFPLFIFETA